MGGSEIVEVHVGEAARFRDGRETMHEPSRVLQEPVFHGVRKLSCTACGLCRVAING